MLRKKSQNCPLDLFPSKRRLSKSHVQFARMCLSIVLSLLVSVELTEGQVSIRERVVISPGKARAVKPPKAIVSGVTSGFIVPKAKGLRTNLQIWYSTETRRGSCVIPPNARIWTDHADTLGHHTVFYDTVAPRFNGPTFYNPQVYNSCLSQYVYDNLYLFNSNSAKYIDTVTKVVPRDTILFAYLTQTLTNPPVNVSVPLYPATPDTQNGDTVGWNASFLQDSSCFPTPSEDLEVAVFLNCTKDSILSQASSPWGPHQYIWARKSATSDSTITALGCALTSMVIVGRGMGLIVDPDTLNNFMKKQPIASTDSSNAQWAALDNWGRQRLFKYLYPLGTGIRGTKLPAPMPLTRIDSLLNYCYGIIAQVYRPKTKHGHWIVLVGKQSNGRYAILDPGVSNNPYLDNQNDSRNDYKNNVYQIRVYGSK